MDRHIRQHDNCLQLGILQKHFLHYHSHQHHPQLKVKPMKHENTLERVTQPNNLLIQLPEAEELKKTKHE